MAITQADIDAIDAAIISGELTIRTQDRTVTYHSKAELIAARGHAAAVLASQSSAGRMAARHQLASFADD
jgi:hypothetical protein